ncbi:hypothetical protein MEO40_08115 [Dolichospermum sp. ST_sed1]|nr:hypothetical protein [Dolichospermum sp. ST_sed1]MDD1424240.1 hypothetical protein [Dolichospermum sp. ST_sed9]MDD1429762.1 hypothetical protein [Dolichospermum sp. ST_sed6]MDD1438655.1 hypothetical protein [Dolichospermum sp. ST_sed10]MDD1440560.1 hypothetical protein [Dolichospermum sp. ST_sed3]MDD1446116.1 hypothetical protein [Dolichospermum sp. ST_sed8]MDD1454734.1 hypothetical protein [Dolichospermum sp. ST_sed7]MDD1459610.1 hypothetical protein [Dolichospermum sp. ST_sed2]MDD14656
MSNRVEKLSGTKVINTNFIDSFFIKYLQNNIPLAVELIASSEIIDQDILYGAVTTGNLWQFGKLDKIEKTIYQDLNLFKIPDDLLDLGKILLGILA